MVLVDALRADYVQRTTHLQRRATAAATGALRECFGFVPRAAYFAGLDAEQYGFTNMFCFDPERSPFGVARSLPASSRGAVVEGAVGLRGFVEEQARAKVPSFAANYLSSIDIPLPYLPYFSPVERLAPWDPKVGYHSLFAILDDHGLPWTQCSWPDSNRLPDSSDQGLVAELDRQLKPKHRFAYLHLQELDAIGHMHGPGSPQLQRALTKTDDLIESLLQSLHERYDIVDLLLFGDHGMVDVLATVDIWALLDGLPLRFGHDYAFFLDSTMARFWFFTEAARRAVTEALAVVPNGRWLEDVERSYYGIADCDWRNGEAYFLVDPGVLIVPNFFQRNGQAAALAGMHGYDPDCTDNLGFFLLRTEAKSTADDGTSKGQLGLVDPCEIFPTLLDLLDLPDQIPSHQTSLRQRPREPKTERFTRHPDADAEQLIGAQLSQLDAALRTKVDADAVVISGSFGRGEGGVFRDRLGRYRPVNDYDLLVVGQQVSRAALDEVAEQLKPEVGTDFLDVGLIDSDLSSLPPTIFNFDLKYGSRVLSGNGGILAAIPHYAPAAIPTFEFVRLLINRSGGLLSGLTLPIFDGGAEESDARRYLTNQVVKALVSVGDWHVARYGGYDASYARRSERFDIYARALGLDSALVEGVRRAYRLKLVPDYKVGLDSLQSVRAVMSFVGDSLRAAIPIMCEAVGDEGPAADLASAMDAFAAHVDGDRQWVQRDNAHWREHLLIGPVLRERMAPGTSVRNAVMATLPLLVDAGLATPTSERCWQLALARLGACFDLPNTIPLTSPHWQALRQRVVQWWLTLVH